jgi:hypothetical protein
VVVDRPGIVEDAGGVNDGVGAILSVDVVKHAERMEGAQNAMHKTSKRMNFWISPHVVGSFGFIPVVDGICPVVKQDNDRPHGCLRGWLVLQLRNNLVY